MMSILRVLAALCVLVAPAAAQTVNRQGGAGVPRAGRPAAQGARATGKLPPAGVAGRGEDKVERIFEKFYDAQGSLRAMARVQTRIMRGIVNHSKSNLPGRVEVYSKAPNKTIAVLSVPGGEQFLQGFDGDAAWVQTPFTGAFIFDQASSSILDRDSEFRRKRASEMFASTMYKGRGEVDGRAVELVEATRPGGMPMLLYFEVEGGLLARADVVLRPRQEEKGVPVTVFIDSYAKVDGVTLPINFRFIYPTHTMTYKLYEIKHNVPIDDTLFVRPKAAPAR